METRSSKGIVREWSNMPDNQGQNPENINFTAYSTFYDMWRRDNIISHAFDMTVAVATHNGFGILPKDHKFTSARNKEIKEATELLNNELNFDEIIDNLLYQMLLYGDSYLELKRKGNSIYELHPLETPEMRINYDKHGKVLGYIQIPATSQEADDIKFKKENIMHFRNKWIGSRLYSYAPLESYVNEFNTKLYANNYLQSIFKNMPPKLMYSLVNASDSQYAEFKNNILISKTDPSRDIIAQVGVGGSVESKLMQVQFDSGLKEIIQYLRQEAIIVTGIPPVWVGVLDSQRGDSEAQIMGFEMKVKKLQQKFESHVNKTLLPELGFKNLMIKFFPPTIKAEKSIIENVRQFKDMGMNDDGVFWYMRKKGLSFPDEAKFKNEEDNSKSIGKKNIDLMPSRVRMDKSTDDKTNNLDQTGVGERVNTRSVSQTTLPDSSIYW